MDDLGGAAQAGRTRARRRRPASSTRSLVLGAILLAVLALITALAVPTMLQARRASAPPDPRPTATTTPATTLMALTTVAPNPL